MKRGGSDSYNNLSHASDGDPMAKPRKPYSEYSWSICTFGTGGLTLIGVLILLYSFSSLRDDIREALVKTKDCSVESGNAIGTESMFASSGNANGKPSTPPHILQFGGNDKDDDSSRSWDGKENKPTRNLDKNAKFFLYRLIGNNMPPLQCFGQLLKNTRYAVKYEPEFPNCRKIWVLNNIVNETEQALILDTLIAGGYTMKDILIRRIDYAAVSREPQGGWTRLVTSQNAARNAMLSHGQSQGATWILAFDGNQYYTREAWEALARAADRWEQQGKKYFKVPMYRMYSDQSPKWLNASTSFSVVKKYAPVLWESQIAFRNDSEGRYVEGMLYGKDNKLELIDRVCGTADFRPKNKRPKVEGQGDVTEDTGHCGCHREAGNERQQRPVVDKVALACGYSVRLWYYPCAGVNASRIFVDRAYRAGLREEGRNYLTDHIVAKVKEYKATHEGQEWKKSVGEGEERVRLGFEEIWGIIEGVLTNGIRNRYEQG